MIEAHPLDQIEIVRRDRRFEMLFRVSARIACLREPIAYVDPAPQMLDAPLQNITSGRNSLLGRGPLCGAGGHDCLLWRTSLRRRCTALPNPNHDGTQNHGDTSHRPSHTSRASPSRAATKVDEIIRVGCHSFEMAGKPRFHFTTGEGVTPGVIELSNWMTEIFASLIRLYL
jgi:hypothetical protein